jgi:type 1 fimbriae regulatory protein FimB
MTMNTTAKNDRNVTSYTNPSIDRSKDRNFITVSELDLLLKGASKTRHPIRNKAILLTIFWHGLRVTELCELKRNDLDEKNARLIVKRLKNSLPTTQPIRPDVLRNLKKYLKIRQSDQRSLFLNERNDQFVRRGINHLLTQCSKLGGLPFHVNPHMLRHGCGYALAELGHDTRLIQDYLGHKNIQHTVIYTRTSIKRFEAIWD